MQEKNRKKISSGVSFLFSIFECCKSVCFLYHGKKPDVKGHEQKCCLSFLSNLAYTPTTKTVSKK